MKAHVRLLVGTAAMACMSLVPPATAAAGQQPAPTRTAAAAQQSTNLLELSLEDLLAIEITSVARKEQTVARTAAAVYVITADDIRRSGATTLPDVLRMAPGFSVSQLNASAWAVTARGFGGMYSNKLLVLIDGRSIYSLEFGGVHWEMQMIPLDTIEQIELIRGPGGSLWGASAVNGVINIITKRADESQGGQVSTLVSNYEPGTVAVRYGSRVGTSATNVTGVRYFQRASPVAVAGYPDGDATEVFQARTRFDWGQPGLDRFSLNADLQQGSASRTKTLPSLLPPYAFQSLDPGHFTAGSATLAWTRTHAADSESSLQASYTAYTRADQVEPQRWHVASLDARHRLALGARHDVVLGSGYRLSFERYPGSRTASPRPDSHAQLVTAFAQDEITLTDRVRVTPGARVERNDDTGVELQPSLRGLWTPTADQSVWAAASRAVRTPNRTDRFAHIAWGVIPSPAPLPLVLTVVGTPDFRSEVLKAYEIGYRFQRARFSLDGTMFVANYRDLVTATLGEPRIGQELGATVLVLPLNLANAVGGQGRGAEVAAMVTLTDRWRVFANYSLLDTQVNSIAANGLDNGATPTHQWHVRTYLDLPHDLSLTGLFYRTSAFPEVQVAAHNRLDTRVAWTFRRRVELAAGLQNLLRDQTPEFRDVTDGSQPAPIHRTAYTSATWRF